MYVVYANKVFDRDEPAVVLVPNDEMKLTIWELNSIVLANLPMDEAKKLMLRFEEYILHHKMYLSESQIFNDEEETPF